MALSPFPSVCISRILVVTSEDSTAFSLQGFLTPAGYEVLRARTAEDAVEIAIAQKPAAIFVEFPLPGCAGDAAESAACLSLCSVARPLFAVGARPDPEGAARAFEAGCSDCLVKPLQGIEILARLRHHVSVEAVRREQDGQIERVARLNAAGRRSVDRTVHDLSNFLLSIRGLAQLLVERSDAAADPQVREMTRSILSASEHALKRVEEALEWGAEEGEPAPSEKESHKVHDLLDEAIGSLSGWAARKEIEVKLMEADAGLVLSCERKKLVRAVENLLSNAVKYSPPGAVVEVEARMTQEGLTIAVRDQGPGFTASDREHFFEEFRRASATPTAGEPSSGLGLAICREIVVAHHGRVECRNLSPRGSEFIINLPRGKDAA
jgi:two-component system, sensor histidine kinase and response regulator